MAVDKKIYIVGIGGTFTAQVAKLAIDLGYRVEGCDDNIYPPMSEVLNKLKIKVDQGYELSHVREKSNYCFIVGNAISRGNPILEHILEHKLTFLSASRWIKENVLTDRTVVAVSGTHGKTTTTAMIVHLLKRAKIDCGYLIGGNAMGLDGNSTLGKDKLFVIEADEYDSAFSEKYPKFMHYHPDFLLINNLEFDHADIYDNLKQIQTHFHYLIRTLSKKAQLILPKNNDAIETVLNIGFYSKKFYWTLTKQKSQPQANELLGIVNSEDFNSITLSILGENKKIQSETLSWQNRNLASESNGKNALSAVSLAMKLGLSLNFCTKSLASFKGVERRMELKFDSGQLKIFDDFAHHPTAIKLALEGLKQNHPKERILAIFDPSSNTMKNGIHSNDQLANCFQCCDYLYLHQPKNAKIDTGTIAEIYRRKFNRKAESFNHSNAILDAVVKEIDSFDIVVVFSNGSFNALIPSLIELIKKDG